MRIWILAVCGLLILASAVHAGSYQQTVSIQNAQIYGDSLNLPEPERDQIVSQGQDYLKNMLRDQMIKVMDRTWLHGAWLYFDPQRSRTGVEAQVGEGRNFLNLPVKAKVRVYANEDVNKYLECGWYLPIEVEVESTCQINRKLKVHTKLEVPFDDFLRLYMGSNMQWSSLFYSHINYSIANRSDVYDGLNMGIGLNLDDWRVNFSYDLTSDYIQLHYFSIAKSF